MLLALLDLFGQGVIKENRITYSPELLELFGEYFDAVRSENDQPTPINPSSTCGETGSGTIILAPARMPSFARSVGPRASRHSKPSRITSFWTMNFSPSFAILSLDHNCVPSLSIATLPTGAPRSLRLPIANPQSRNISGNLMKAAASPKAPIFSKRYATLRSVAWCGGRTITVARHAA